MYVIDDDVLVFRRPSLPNIRDNSRKGSVLSLAFDSRLSYPSLADFVPPEALPTSSCAVPSEYFEELQKAYQGTCFVICFCDLAF